MIVFLLIWHSWIVEPMPPIEETATLVDGPREAALFLEVKRHPTPYGYAGAEGKLYRINLDSLTVQPVEIPVLRFDTVTPQREAK